MSDPRIDISDVEFDAAAVNLRKIQGALKPLESQLKRSLADGIPGELGARVVDVVLRSRARADSVGDSAVRQADELMRRAVFARIANDTATQADMELLVAMCAGPTAIDLSKRKSYAFLLKKIQDRLSGGKIGGGKDGVKSPIDLALERWGMWAGQRGSEAQNGHKPKPPKFTDLWKQVFAKPFEGKKPPKTLEQVMTAFAKAKALQGGGSPAPAVAPTEPTPPPAESPQEPPVAPELIDPTLTEPPTEVVLPTDPALVGPGPDTPVNAAGSSD